MKKYIVGTILSIGILISPSFTQAAGLTTDQATVLINVVKASPSTPANAFVDLITAFSGVTINQATALITVVQSSPATSANVFIPLLISFTTDTSTTQTTTQSTTQTTTQSAAVKSPTCTLNVAYGPGGVAKKYGLTGTGYYDGGGSTYVEIHDGEPVTVSWASTNTDYSQGPGGDKDVANGSATYYPGADKAYVWNFYGPGGSTSCGVMVEIIPSKSTSASTIVPSATIYQSTFTPGTVTLAGTATGYSEFLIHVNTADGSLLSSGKASLSSNQWSFTPESSLVQETYMISVYGYPGGILLTSKIITRNQ